jgi:hypothetical protein
MSVEVLKQQFEKISRGPPVYKDILSLTQKINQSISNVKPSRSIFSFSKKKNQLKKLKQKLNTLTSKNMYSIHRKGFLNTVHEENRRQSARRGRGKTAKISRAALSKIRENRTSRNASRSRASRSSR